MRPFITREILNDTGRKYDVCLQCNEFFPAAVTVISTSSEIKADMLVRRLNDLREDFGVE